MTTTRSQRKSGALSSFQTPEVAVKKAIPLPERSTKVPLELPQKLKVLPKLDF